MTKRKKCNDCGKRKALSQYYKGANQPDGLAIICKPCSKERSQVTNRALAALRDRHREEYLLIRAELMGARRRAE